MCIIGLITALCDQIQAQLNPHYTAVITPYVAFESLEIAPVRLAAVPDIGILESDVFDSGGAAVAIEAAPLTMPAIMEVPTRYARLEIRTVGDETALVTAIELLSPANKRPGAEGAEAYEKKRQELFRSEAHLLEIDLLRNGRRTQTARPLPDNPYFVLLSRAERRPRLEVWPLGLRTPIRACRCRCAAPTPMSPSISPRRSSRSTPAPATSAGSTTGMFPRHRTSPTTTWPGSTSTSASAACGRSCCVLALR